MMGKYREIEDNSEELLVLRSCSTKRARGNAWRVRVNAWPVRGVWER